MEPIYNEFGHLVLTHSDYTPSLVRPACKIYTILRLYSVDGIICRNHIKNK